MAKDKPDDLSVRRQQLDDEESAGIDAPHADRLREQQSAESRSNTGQQAGGAPGGGQQSRGTQEEITRSDKVQDELDDALAASFPASDPVSIVTSQKEEDWGPGAQSRPGNDKNRRSSKGDSSQPPR